jgi:Replication-relaxation
MARQSFSKFVRPQEVDRGQISDRDLDILAIVLRYRFCSAAQVVHLVGGNEDVTHRRLRRLWEWQFVNRWAFPGLRSHSEFYYYLDNRASLNLLAERRGLEIHAEMLEEIRNNREKDYANAAVRGQHMQLGFLQHSLMISRMPCVLELACGQSDSRVELESWCQGGTLQGHKVEVPKVRSTRSGTEYFWEESSETERLPVEPDALFTLRVFDRPHDQQLVHFFYEADRGTMTTTDMLRKFRAYYHFIKKQQRHRECFGVHPIRAVLVETTHEARGRRLMDLVNHPLVAGPNRRSGLFWFSISPLLAEPFEMTPAERPLPRYLRQPEIIFDSIWALPDLSMHSLSSVENSRGIKS